MSASYDAELPAALDRMRLRLGDTNVDPEENALAPDETYLALLSLQGEALATATLAESFAARFAQEPGTVSVNGKMVSWKDRVSTWLELATRLRSDAGAGTPRTTYAGPRVGVLSTTAPQDVPTGYPDPNSGYYRGDPLARWGPGSGS